MANKPLMSFYESKESQVKKDIDIDAYIGMVQHGTVQDAVIEGRRIKQSGDDKAYKEYKAKVSKLVTASAIMHPGSKAANNIKELNGLIVIDIDKDQVTDEIYHNLKNDKHTYVMHQSFGGGQNYCVFVKINKDKFKDSFNCLAQYYYENYDITIDPSCSNPNRLRFLSWDEDIFVNDKSAKFIAKDVKKHAAPKEVNFVFTQSDFDHILDQIKSGHIDLCKEDYHRYVRIGLALYNKFGSTGEEYFHFICQYGSKYNRAAAEKDWRGFCKNADGSCKIGTLYYYCKEAGITIYSPKTEKIIERVDVAKNQGNPTVESITKNLKVANDITCDSSDLVLIQELIDSNIDFTKTLSAGDSEIEQLERFIITTFTPCVDEITNTTYINGDTHLTDTETNDIYLKAKKKFDFNVNIGDVRVVLNSNSVGRVNALKQFIMDNECNPYGIIDAYAKCIHPQTEYNVWAFKKWIVGALHNWFATPHEKLVSPLTLVLTGQQHGTGKTSFLRNIMPRELSKYSIEAKINGHDKDSMYLLCNSLLVLDDEFGGKAFKDVKEYKAIADTNIVTQRRPYERESKTFKRRAALCGTTNEIDILKDVTGNRRILPINVERIDYETVLSIDKTSLILEAYNLMRDGFDWIIRTQEDIDYLNNNSERNQTVLPIEEIFFRYFSLTKTDNFLMEEHLNQGEIVERLNVLSPSVKPTKYELKEVYIKNKMEYKNKRVGSEQKKCFTLYTKLNNHNNNDEIAF